jgi:ribonuclease D
MPYREEDISIYWIDDDTELARAVESWGAIIALDTEFIRTNTFYPIPGLYQVASGSDIFLIDPLVIEEWQPFKHYLLNPETVKVLHACQEDLELIYAHLQIVPQNVVDTQLANAYVSENYSLSYARLVEQNLGVQLDKQQTRSDWLQRPLSDDQLHYAVADVVHLVAIFQQLQELLHDKQRWSWFQEDMQQRASYEEPQPQFYYRQVKRAWQLNLEQLTTLQKLCEWREQTARKLDTPRNRVIWDEHLFAFAQVHALNESTLNKFLPAAVVRRYGRNLIEAHQRGRESETTVELLDRPLSPSQGARLKALRDVAKETAMSLGMAPELLARKKDVEACLRHFMFADELSATYSGWRGDVVGASFLQILETAG